MESWNQETLSVGSMRSRVMELLSPKFGLLQPEPPGNWVPWKTLNLAPCETGELLLTLCSLAKLKQLYCVLRFHCIALVISLLMNQTKTLTSKLGTPESWKSRTLEPWNSRNLQPCNPGNLQLWNLGTLQNLGTLPGDITASEPWNLLLGCEAGLMLFLVVCGCSCHLLSLLIGAILVIVIAVVHLLVAVTAGLLLTLLLLRLSW